MQPLPCCSPLEAFHAVWNQNLQEQRLQLGSRQPEPQGSCDLSYIFMRFSWCSTTELPHIFPPALEAILEGEERFVLGKKGWNAFNVVKWVACHLIQYHVTENSIKKRKKLQEENTLKIHQKISTLTSNHWSVGWRAKETKPNKGRTEWTDYSMGFPSTKIK